MKSRLQLLLIALFLFGIVPKASAIEYSLKGVTGGKTDPLLVVPANAFGEVDATANGVNKKKRDPLVGKVDVTKKAIDANVPDFTVGIAPNDATVGGRAELNPALFLILNPANNKIMPFPAGVGELRAKADQNGAGKADSLSRVVTDPQGFFDSLDDDNLSNDALILFLIEPTSSPIFNNIDPTSDSGSFSATANVQGSFFNGNVYTIETEVGTQSTPTPFVEIAPDWEIFNVIQVGNTLEVNFSGSGLTASQFEDAWTSYITAPNGSGFGGSSSFGAFFVKRDIPENQLGEWTWDSSLSGEVRAIGVPEPLTMLGSATALGFGAFFKRKLKPSKSSEKETTKVG